MKSYGYVTLLSSESYLPGVLALARSLKASGTKIPFECVCSKDLDENVVARLHQYGISTSRLSKSATEGLEIPNDAAFAHWKHTFDKLLLWDIRGGSSTRLCSSTPIC